MKKPDIAMIGLSVMGANLARNMDRNGFTVAVWDHDPSLQEAFLSAPGETGRFLPASSLSELAGSLERPRRIMMMIRAGDPVDEVIGKLIPFLDPGDIVVDGGNSLFEDTVRRVELLSSHGILFVGTGISGGEEGALNGPSIMPGGNHEAWAGIRPVLEAIAAKLADGTPCCRWIGGGGAGHFVKMVHNGIEYGDMQLICEAYHILSRLGGYGNDELHELFDKWNRGDLASYLIEITSRIFAVKDEDGVAVLDRIQDKAGQKNTGMWSVKSALDLGSPLTMIGESVFARMISARRAERIEASGVLAGPEPGPPVDKELLARYVHDALTAARIVAYAQGFSLISDASDRYGWDIDNAALAGIWRGGCIIRSGLLEDISAAYSGYPQLKNLLTDPRFVQKIAMTQDGWRRLVAAAVTAGIPVPAFSSALAYYDSYRCDRLPANLLQAQRDFFGAHTYERTDRPEGEFYHTLWS